MLKFSSKTAFSGKNFTSICNFALQSLSSCARLRGGGQFFTIVALVSVFTGVFAPTKGWGQGDLTIKTYASSVGSGPKVDGTVLDQIFGTVVADGVTINQQDFFFQNHYSTLPTTYTGFNNVQCVIFDAIGVSSPVEILKTQADALIDYVKNGGILIASAEQVTVENNGYFLKYVGERLLGNGVTLTTTASLNTGINPVPAFHPGNGVLLLNSNGATSVPTSTSYAVTIGVPSAASILLGQSGISTTCDSVPVLDFIAPCYPKVCNNAQVNGFAILSGEFQGPLNTLSRNESQLNKNYAQLIYDCLYPNNPISTSIPMITRCNWSTIPTNRNATCRPYIKVPDFTPTIEIENIAFWPNAERDFLVNISEIIYGQSCGQVVVKIFKPSGFDITFSPTMTTANVNGVISVNNNLWTKTENSLFITLTLNPGVIISGYDISQIGMHVKRKSGTPAQTNQPITAVIVDGSGNDSNNNDNNYGVVIKAQ